MTGAKRRINSTGRRRISHDRIEVRMLDSKPGEPLKAKARVDLEGMELPLEATIVIEAYHRSSGMRFECGTVGQLSIPDVLALEEVDRDCSPLFRLKVIDTGVNKGRILASAERIQPKSDDDEAGRKSLFPISYRDLKADIWKVVIEPGDRPRLIINTRLPGFAYKLAENPLLQGLVLPAALRFVLQELVVASDTGEDEDEVSWKDEWLAYCGEQLGAAEDPRELTDDNEKANWIDDAVQRFGEKCDFVKRIAKMGEET